MSARPFGRRILSALHASQNLLESQAFRNHADGVLLRSFPDSVKTDLDLRVIVPAWGQRPDAVKAGILAMTRAVAREANRQTVSARGKSHV